MTGAFTPTADKAMKLVVLIVGLTAAVAAMLAAFALPAVHGGPNHVKLGLVGQQTAVEMITDNLNPDEWETIRFENSDDLAEAIENREVAGGVAFGAEEVAVYMASAGGAPAASAVLAIGTTVAEQQRLTVEEHDVVPFPKDDPHGAGFIAVALPIVFGGVIPAIGLTQLFPGRSHLLLRVVGAVGFAAIAGAALTAILQFGIGSLAGNYWVTSGGFALGMAAISLTIVGLEGLFGPIGIAIGGVVMMFIGNPLSGLATGSNWLPGGWSNFGQVLPPGATGTLLRADSFFGGTGGEIPTLVLLGWVILGLVLAGIASRLQPANDNETLASA